MTVGADTSSHTISGLARSDFYYFRVHAVDAAGATSAYTNVVKVRTSKK